MYKDEYDDEEDNEEEEDDEDDNMSISYFSNDQDFSKFNITKNDPLTYFENRMLNNKVIN